VAELRAVRGGGGSVPKSRLGFEAIGGRQFRGEGRGTPEVETVAGPGVV
jgi:hypothetical protein